MRPTARAKERGWRGWLPAGIAGGFTLLALAFHLSGYSDRPLWSDEASTYWTVQAGLGELLRGARTDGTPPLHFLMVYAATRAFGSSEIVLRLPSLVAAVLVVPAAYALARRMTTTRAAVIAAGLAAFSPLVHYYSVEARGYALVQLETLAVVFATWSAVLAPARIRSWVLLTLALTVELWTHNYALFLLPAPVLTILAAGGKDRAALAARAAAATALAFALYLPWFSIVTRHSGTGVGDWIVPFWLETPPLAAVLRSFEVFGFGGMYPRYLSYLGTASAFRQVSIPLTAVVLAVACCARWPAAAFAGDARRAKALLVGFVLLPLLAAWSASFVRSPLYLVGRYDTIVLPVFLILFAAGLDALWRARSAAGVAAIVVTAGLAAVTHTTSLLGEVPDDDDVIAAHALASRANALEPVIATGLRRPVVEYYLDRAAHHMQVSSFPAEVGEHPGWYSAARLLGDRPRLERDAEQLADSMAATGRRVWVLGSPQNDVDAYLWDALKPHFVIDAGVTQQRVGLFGMVPRREGTVPIRR